MLAAMENAAIQFKLEDVQALLGRTPDVIRTMLQGLDDEWIHGRYGESTFCPFDVVGHLIHGEKTDWMVRLKIILEHGTSETFPPFDRYAMAEHSKNQTIETLLGTFESLRRRNLEALEQIQLKEQDLKQKGMHPELGVVTLEALLATWVVHDLNHIAQIAKALSFQYKNYVGPWTAYLSILKPPNPAG